jgi:hypothetical protein
MTNVQLWDVSSTSHVCGLSPGNCDCQVIGVVYAIDPNMVPWKAMFQDNQFSYYHDIGRVVSVDLQNWDVVDNFKELD